MNAAVFDGTLSYQEHKPSKSEKRIDMVVGEVVGVDVSVSTDMKKEKDEHILKLFVDIIYTVKIRFMCFTNKYT